MARALIIEDEPGLRQVIRQALERHGLEVAEAADGAEGLMAFRQLPCDLVITDIVLPKREGIDVISSIKRDRPATRIIAISGGGPARYLDFLRIARKAGADSALSKPFRKGELLGRVDRLLAEAADDG